MPPSYLVLAQSSSAVLETRKRVLGEEHPDTLSPMDNLSLTQLGAVDGGGRAVYASDGEEKNGTWGGVSRRISCATVVVWKARVGFGYFLED